MQHSQYISSTSHARIILALPVTAATALLPLPVAAGQSTSRLSVDANGQEGNQNSDHPSISADGRFVSFASRASNLVPGDTNAYEDVFVRDLVTGAIERASVDSGGLQSNGISQGSSMSTDGRFVVFESSATNLVPGDVNGEKDIFVRDRQAGTTELVSLSTTGLQSNYYSFGASISADGRFVAFTSLASNLVPNDSNFFKDIFVRDRVNGTIVCASVTPAGTSTGGGGDYSSISANGRFVVFESASPNLVSGDTNGLRDVFVRDLQNGVTERINVGPLGEQADDWSMIVGNSVAPHGSIASSDGRFIVFNSGASNLVAGDTNGKFDVFVRDRASGKNRRVSVSSGGSQADSDSSVPVRISDDGRFVAYSSLATNLVTGDTNGQQDVFVHDLQLGITDRVSVATGGNQGDAWSWAGSLSSDGRVVVFGSHATNLVVGDTNGSRDVFIRDRGPHATGGYCTAGTTTHGCIPSIRGIGTPSASATNGFTVSIGNVEGQKLGLIFYGVDNSAFTPLAWGSSSSYLCVKAPLQRTPVVDSGGNVDACDGALALDWNEFRADNPLAVGQPIAAGQHVFAQGWFRDPPSPKATMLSDALEFVVQP